MDAAITEEESKLAVMAVDAWMNLSTSDGHRWFEFGKAVWAVWEAFDRRRTRNFSDFFKDPLYVDNIKRATSSKHPDKPFPDDKDVVLVSAYGAHGFDSFTDRFPNHDFRDRFKSERFALREAAGAIHDLEMTCILAYINYNRIWETGYVASNNARIGPRAARWRRTLLHGYSSVAAALFSFSS